MGWVITHPIESLVPHSLSWFPTLCPEFVGNHLGVDYPRFEWVQTIDVKTFGNGRGGLGFRDEFSFEGGGRSGPHWCTI